MSGYRLPSGGLVDRTKPLNFTFDGKPRVGFAGDTLASALLANGVDVVGRSFKYHRPRGLLAAGIEEPNAVMQLETGAATIPNLKATGVELYEGLAARAVNAWPNARVDVMSVNSLFARFLPAGFYYKTFMWPDWRLFEPSIRRAAGLGKSPAFPDPDSYEKRYAACDVLVVGAGPAGLAAALAASRSGARVMLVEMDAEVGGFFLNRAVSVGDRDGRDWAHGVAEEIAAAPETTVLNRTMAFGYYDHNLVALIERLTDHLPPAERKGPRQRFWKVRAKRVILATGAFERPLAFPNNDRPGVMLAGAAETYARRYGAAPGRRVVVATNNDSAYHAAQSLVEAGVEVVAVADARPEGPAADVRRTLTQELAVLPGVALTNVKSGGPLKAGVREAELHAVDASGRAAPGKRHAIECDAVLTSGGWSPAVHLFSQSGGKVVYDDRLAAFLPGRSVQNEQSVGAAAGVFDLREALRQAGDAGAAAARDLGFDASPPEIPVTEGFSASPPRALWSVDVSALGRGGAKSWLDFQNDVTSSDVRLAVRESFRSVEHVKRYTTLGMATDQGKTSNVNAIGVMEAALEKPIPDIGVTTFRPPFDPVSIGAFAGARVGRNFAPARRLAADARHAALGASFDDYGGWRRPAFYPQDVEDEAAAVQREAKAVRESAGLFDASPLGKIEVRGPDAAEFLNRMYVNNMKSLKVGRCRYGLMLDENGVVYDDGVLARLGEDHYLVGTTSGHASAIAEMFDEWLQCEWTDLNVVCADVTTAWAVVNVAGPAAREILEAVETDIDLSPDAFPHMQARASAWRGAPCRIQRVSFSGELSYEVSVPWARGPALWDALFEAGRAHNITPFGIEALMVLRVEKGFLHVGSDTDGMTLPQDVGFGPVIARKKGDFVGRRSTMRPDGARAARRQLVGLDALEGDAPLTVGAHVLPLGASVPAPTEGWVSSSVFSPTLGRPVALGLVANGVSRLGEEVAVWDLGQTRRARIVAPGSFDREGERLNG